MSRSNASRNVKGVKQPWWYVTKTEAQAFWLGGCQAALALFGWVVVGDGRQRTVRKGLCRLVDATGCGDPNNRSGQTSSVGSFGGRLSLRGDVVEFRFNV
jgi:hypothetical protein